MTETAQQLVARLTGFTPRPHHYAPTTTEHVTHLIRDREGYGLAEVTDMFGLPASANAALYAAAPDLHRELTAALAREAALLKEGSALSAWQCIFTDGKTGLVGDEYGNQFCQMHRHVTEQAAEIVRLRSLLAELYATVKGECPSLLNGDSGGNDALDLDICATLEVKP